MMFVSARTPVAMVQSKGIQMTIWPEAAIVLETAICQKGADTPSSDMMLDQCIVTYDYLTPFAYLCGNAAWNLLKENRKSPLNNSGQHFLRTTEVAHGCAQLQSGLEGGEGVQIMKFTDNEYPQIMKFTNNEPADNAGFLYRPPPMHQFI